MGWLIVILTAICFSTMAFVSRLATGKGAKPEGLNLAVSGFAALLAFIICLIRGDFTFSNELLFYAAISGFFGITAYIFMVYALKTGHYGFTLSVVSSSFLLPVIYSVIVWKEQIMAEGVVLIIASIFLIALSEEKKTDAKKSAWGKWLMFVLLAFFLNGICQTTQAVSSGLPKEDTIKFLFVNYSVSTLICLVLVLRKKEFTFTEIKYGAIAGTLSLCGIFLTISACMLLPKNIVFSVWSTLYTLLGALVSVLFFKERISKLGYLGIAFAIAGIILVSLKITLLK